LVGFVQPNEKFVFKEISELYKMMEFKQIMEGSIIISYGKYYGELTNRDVLYYGYFTRLDVKKKAILKSEYKNVTDFVIPNLKKVHAKF